jgi:hypothetical protein
MDAQFPKFAATMDSVLTTELPAPPSHPMAAVSLVLQLRINVLMDPVLSLNLTVSYPMAATLQHHKGVLRMVAALRLVPLVQQILLQTVTRVLMVAVFQPLLIVPH